MTVDNDTAVQSNEATEVVETLDQMTAATQDSSDFSAAMRAGFNLAKGDAPEEPEKDSATEVVAQAQEEQPQTQENDDPEVFEGLTRSQLKAKLAEVDAIKEKLEKSTASLHGHVGNLKGLIQQAGQGKPISKESLKRLSAEFPDFAELLVEDLKEAGLGGSALDQARIDQIISERTAKVQDDLRADFERKTRETEVKFVKRAHSDAMDYFNGGKHFEQAKAFLATLPKERQDEFQTNGWDSDVVIRFLDDFKAHQKKAADGAASAAQRIKRAVAAPSAGGRVMPMLEDPLKAGWARVNGRR